MAARQHQRRPARAPESSPATSSKGGSVGVLAAAACCGAAGVASLAQLLGSGGAASATSSARVGSEAFLAAPARAAAFQAATLADPIALRAASAEDARSGAVLSPASFAPDAPSTAASGFASAAGVAAASALAVGALAGAQRRRKVAQRKWRLPRAAESAPAVSQAMPTSGYFPPRPTPLLDSMNNEGTEKVRSMTVDQLKQLAEEVRWQTLDAVSVTGGHLGAGLGVLDLTVALHHVFNTPDDEICWDVAHQCQPHKVLTGRRDRIYTLRQGGGLSGFTKRKESPYDAFGAGHSGTSISAAVGFAEARKRLGEKGHSIAVIGDGAITGGMAWEAMNHAGGLKSKVIVILNDNGQVSLPTMYNSVDTPVGALSETLKNTEVQSAEGIAIQGSIAKFETSEAYQRGRQLLKDASAEFLPGKFQNAVAKFDEYTRDFIKTVPFSGSGSGSRGELFEQLGFQYVGPIDGHDMATMVEVLKNIKHNHETDQWDKPVLLHIKTQKGKGYEPAQEASDRLHAVKPKFNLPKDTPPAAKTADQAPKRPALTNVMAEAMIREAERDDKIVAITAAMPGGTGVGLFEKRFGAARTFDVGIAEQHAVTMAASMAAGGLKPFCCIYSTFLQRGYDQLVHDVAIQNLPVRFIIDRAGLVGADGPTHGGTFDLSYLGCIPNLLICAPADEAELVNMMHTVAKIDHCPTALRYPRGNAYGDVELPTEPEFLEPGKGRIVREGKNGTIALLSVGSRLRECMKAAERLERWGISATVADARWVKPVDVELCKKLATEHRALITIEENAIGGFSAQVQQALFDSGVLDGASEDAQCAVRSMVFPDRWIEHDDPELQYDDAELNAGNIVEKALTVLAKVGVAVDAPEKAA
eukprot:TRINITY_DN62764_c0_g1_i1.p1 TRINITY_DN62764_c0_g1~~TRINITY_DN62764_c0_g1_i1.p1  ORF type:complete len:872 (+),score=232.11 TRINITY_DN62764_c0_g1_i1:102-2717(+)